MTEGPKPPLVTRPIGLPAASTIGVAFARRGAAVGADADPLARRPFDELAQNDRVAGEAALDLSTPADGPGEIGLDRGCGFVDVVPVQAEPSFETQRIAGAKADRHYFRFGEQPLGQTKRVGGRQRDLEPVLAGIARAGDQALPPVEHQFGRGHERHCCDASGEARQDCGSGRPLQRQQGAIFERLDRNCRAETFAQMREVSVLASQR